MGPIRTFALRSSMVSMVPCVVILLLCVGGTRAKTTLAPVTTTFDLDQFFRTTFKTMDLNHDGTLTFLEFESLWKMADADGDGILTLREYSTSGHFSKFIATELYNYIDHDHNNIITMQEVPRIYLEYDSNADGKVDVQEFVDEYHRIYNWVVKEIGPDIE